MHLAVISLPFLALIADLIFADPNYRLHPTRVIGLLCSKFEDICQKAAPNERAAGILTVCSVLGTSLFSCWFILEFFNSIGRLFCYLAALFLVYSCIAMKDMVNHSTKIQEALSRNDLDQARIYTSYIVGRDTANLDESEIARATIESIAENTVDGTTAPLFYAVLGAVIWGAQGAAIMAVLYRCANTMDSMFGYKNEKYLHFGWAAAKFDDLLNYIPARLTALIIIIAAAITNRDAGNTMQTILKDGGKHPSPNSGLSEAGFAGALGVRLGGVSYYKGIKRESEIIAEGNPKPKAKDIPRANTFLLTTSFISYPLFTLLAQILYMLH